MTLVKFLNGATKGKVVVMSDHQALKLKKIGMVKILKVYEEQTLYKGEKWA